MAKPEDDLEDDDQDYDREYRRGDRGPKYAPHENDPDEFHPPDSNDKLFGVFAHLGVLAFGILIPVIFYFIFADKKPFVTRHCKESINYRITFYVEFMVALLIAGLVGLLAYAISQQGIVAFVAGYIAFIVLAMISGIVQLILLILAAVAAGNGREYRYPYCIRLF